MMSMEKFKQISLRGRVAYGVSCFENVLLALKYNLNDWKIVLNYLWEFTNSSNLEECNTIANELILRICWSLKHMKSMSLND